MSQLAVAMPARIRKKPNKCRPDASGRLLFIGIPRLSAEQAIYKIDIMKITKNIGMILLAVYLIVDGLLGFGLNFGPAIFLLYIVALAAGVFILIGK